MGTVNHKDCFRAIKVQLVTADTDALLHHIFLACQEVLRDAFIHGLLKWQAIASLAAVYMHGYTLEIQTKLLLKKNKNPWMYVMNAILSDKVVIYILFLMYFLIE